MAALLMIVDEEGGGTMIVEVEVEVEVRMIFLDGGGLRDEENIFW